MVSLHTIFLLKVLNGELFTGSFIGKMYYRGNSTHI